MVRSFPSSAVVRTVSTRTQVFVLAISATTLAWAESENAGNARGIFVMDARTGATRTITDGSYPDFDPRWSPDGRTIVFSSRRESDLNIADLYLVPVSGGDPIRLETRDGLVGECSDACWSPDGSQLAFTTNVRGHYEIAIATIRDGKVARLERPNRTPFDATSPEWRPDGRAVIYLYHQDAEVSVRRVFVASKADDPLADVPGVHLSPRLGADSETEIRKLDAFHIYSCDSFAIDVSCKQVPKGVSPGDVAIIWLGTRRSSSRRTCATRARTVSRSRRWSTFPTPRR